MSHPIYRLENVIQPYDWGSRTAIAELLGKPASGGEPQAEMWMGTHHKGPSTVVDADRRMPLAQLIERHPAAILGRTTVQRFGAALPFLFKVLAAARPLSIQAHPGKAQARAGFAKENHDGRKPLDAPDRNYRDANHKPEIICALTPFWGLNGFRPAAEAVRLLAPICPGTLMDAFQSFQRRPRAGMAAFFKATLQTPPDQRGPAVAQVREKAAALTETHPAYAWIDKLAHVYPADLGVLSPALLNLVRLDPGEAMFLPAGQLHAYLDGAGIELMANSDNVLRGGLTRKHVDVAELLDVVRFVETRVAILEAQPLRTGEWLYSCPATEFALSVVRTAPAQPYRAPADRSVEILLCTAGEGRIATGDTQSLTVKKGDSLLVPAAADPYLIDGHLTVYKAAVPLEPSRPRAGGGRTG